jgi:Fe-S-cluster containining protein
MSAPEDPVRGLGFVHKVDSEDRERLRTVSASLAAARELLVERGLVDAQDLAMRQLREMERQVARAHQQLLVDLGEPGDKYAVVGPEIDCAARLPLCRARCCTLTFALSQQDLDERVVRWDYGRPYQIGRRDDGWCVHHEGDGRCGVYAQRPAPCRRFDCRGDTRIWLDFERRIPAP